jgi:RNA-directed DNA polymerase
LANFYLGRVDRYVKETLRLPGYVRYMDDMALWGDRHELKPARVGIERMLTEALGLRIKPTWHLQPTRRGMSFLGYRVFPRGSELSRASRRRFRRKWAACERGLADGRMGESEAQRRVLALAAFVRAARNETILNRLFGRGRAIGPNDDFRTPAIGLQPRQPRRQLEQRRPQLPLRQPQQERAGQPQQQPRLPPRSQLMPRGPDGPPD